MHKPSIRQQNILDEWNTTDNNILIGAVAGSGKTSTLMLLLEACKYKTLFLAFNKSIQEEIQAKIDAAGMEQGKALTMHSLGLQAIRHAGKRVEITNSKNWALLKILTTKFKKLLKPLSREDKMKLNYLFIDLNDTSRMSLTDNYQELIMILKGEGKDIMNLPFLPELWEEFIEIRKESYEGKTIQIDFNDMIYLPVVNNYSIPVHPYYLMVDEAQDLNLAQHGLIDILINQGAIRKWIAVGDRNQAIYGFSGASSKSFDLFLDKAPNVVEKPLDICYRCDTNIIDAANEVYPVMQAAEGKGKGIVGVETDFNLIKPDSMVVCRNTSPLVDLYFTLMMAHKPAYIYGMDIMNSLQKFLRPYKEDTIQYVLTDLSYKYEDLERDKTDEGKYKLAIFRENYTIFRKMSEMCSRTETIQALFDRIKKIFETKKGAIKLCTIHKSKGLEAKVVYILEENLIPSKYAKSPEQITQEFNLKYVARTRAKNELYYLNLQKEYLEEEHV